MEVFQEEWSSSASSTTSEEDLSLDLEPKYFDTDKPHFEKHSKRTHFLKKLFYRELRGTFAPHQKAPILKPFDEVPESNQICLSSILPTSAFNSNHVFLGLSKCGQFLLSYTYTADMDIVPFNTVYKYRLHWWAFVPHKKARKVAEVMLFGDQGVYSTLYIAFCQWPSDYSRVLVYGNCYEPGMGNSSQPERSYITITTVPSLNKCHDCLTVAASYEDEDLAASWDSCVRFSCLKHGMTVHTNFDVVSPYPKFNPQISLKCEGAVLINTGSLLHVLRTDMEHVYKHKSESLLDKSDSSKSTVIDTETLSENVITKPSDDDTETGSVKIENTFPCFHAPKDNCHQLKINQISRTLLCQDVDDDETLKLTADESVINNIKSDCEIQESKYCSSVDAVEKNTLDSSLEFSVTASESSIDSFSNTSSRCTSACTDLKSPAGTYKMSPKHLESTSENNFVENCDMSLNVEKYLENGCDNCDDDKNKDMSVAANKSCKSDYSTCDTESFSSSLDTLERFEELEEHSSAKCLKNLENLSLREKIILEFSHCVYTGQISKARSIAKGEYNFENSSRITGDKTVEVSNVHPHDGPWRNQSLMEIKKTDEIGFCYNFHVNQEGSASSRNQSRTMSTLLIAKSHMDGQDCSINMKRTRGTERDRRQRLFFKRRDVTNLSPRSRKFRGSVTAKLSNAAAPNPSTSVTSFNRTRNKVSAEAEKAYEFTDDSSDGSHEKLSSFRRRRLADKKYEFCEEGEDAENIVPFHLHRRRESCPEVFSSPQHFTTSWRRHHETYSELPELVISNPRSPGSPYTFISADIHSPQQPSAHIEVDKVLRPVNRNMAGALLLSPRDRDSFTEWGVKSSSKKVNNISDCISAPELFLVDNFIPTGNNVNNSKPSKKEISNPSPQENNSNDQVGCTVELKRRFIEVDDELVSVITDIEDDELCEATGYHNALPLEVHGTGYAQMQMISNSKAEKLMAPCVLIQQRSFDVEKFCHEVAERLCEESGKKYWFCNDYDVEIVDVCPFTGDAIALAVMRVEATVKTKGLAKSQRSPVSSMERKQYQGGCTFVWNLVSGKYDVVDENPLAEVDPYDILEEPWNPAREMAKNLRNSLPQTPVCQQARFITNHLVLKGVSLEYLTDMENMIGLILQDDATAAV